MTPRPDDNSINNEEDLWRRILPGWLHREPTGEVRPSSIAFRDVRSGEVSVHRATLATVDGVLGPYPADSLAAVEAAVPRAHRYTVASDPQPEDPSHCVLCSPDGRRNKKAERAMALAARWVLLRPEIVR